MYNILTLNNISKVGTNLLKNNYICSSDTLNPDAILLRSQPMHDFKLNENLLAIVRLGAGTNNIPIEKCSKNGTVVFNTPGANANAVKELVISSLISSSRKIFPSISWLQSISTKSGDFSKTVEKYKSIFSGSEIKGKKLGVIGLGSIGSKIANAAISLDMDVFGFDPYISIDSAWELCRRINHVTTMDELLSTCDYISVHVPLNESTKNLISYNEFRKMKPGVHLLNYSRAGIVDNSALLDSINSGKVTSYSTDFPDKELMGNPSIIVTPHLGASTKESENNCAIMAASQLRDFIENGNIKNSVNLPDISMNRAGDKRICIFYYKSNDMIATLTSILSDCSINIENIQCKSKGNLAYTIIDITGDFEDLVAKKISSIDNVIRLRVI